MNYNDDQRKKQIERCRTYGKRHLSHIEDIRERFKQSRSQISDPLPVPKETNETPSWVIERIERELKYYSKPFAEVVDKLKCLNLSIERYHSLLLLLNRCKPSTKPTTLPTELSFKKLTKAKYTNHLGKVYATARIRWFQEHGKEPLFLIKDGVDRPRIEVDEDVQFLLDLYYKTT